LRRQNEGRLYIGWQKSFQAARVWSLVRKSHFLCDDQPNGRDHTRPLPRRPLFHTTRTVSGSMASSKGMSTHSASSSPNSGDTSCIRLSRLSFCLWGGRRRIRFKHARSCFLGGMFVAVVLILAVAGGLISGWKQRRRQSGSCTRIGLAVLCVTRGGKSLRGRVCSRLSKADQNVPLALTIRPAFVLLN